MLEAIRNKWNSTVVTGETPAIKPDIPGFVNCASAIETIAWAINNKAKIAVHCDVDVDGIGSGYIFKRAMSFLTGYNQIYMINAEKKHGIQQEHVELLKRNPVDLLVILDSSSNSLDIIKQFKCNVLVIDHHEVDHNELKGRTYDGKHVYLIVNNTIDNPYGKEISCWLKSRNPNTTVEIADYQADSKMSCGLVVYELFRLFCEAFNTGPILENSMLYQWAGVTLITDAILLNTPRNQWYMEKTVCATDIEPSLKVMVQELNPYALTLSKSLIGYTFAPTINRAIRAGASSEALAVILNNPYDIKKLQVYRALQDEVVSKGIENYSTGESYTLKDLSDTDISSNYSGVIAGKLLDITHKNTVVYKVNDGIAQGSFRGRVPDADYKAKFNEFGHGALAQGHKVSFGFQAIIEDLPEIMESLADIESGYTDKPYLTAGNTPEEFRGQYHIDNIDEFKRAGGIIMLANGNAKLSSQEQIMIHLQQSDAKLIEVRGKLYLYDVLGFHCKAFSPVDGPFNLYIEQSKMIDFYIK